MCKIRQFEYISHDTKKNVKRFVSFHFGICEKRALNQRDLFLFKDSFRIRPPG